MAKERFDVNGYIISSINPGKIFTITFADMQSSNSNLPATFSAAPVVDINNIDSSLQLILVEDSITTTQFKVAVSRRTPRSINEISVNFSIYGERA